MAEVPFVPVVHICGNGIRTSSETCDDNNTIGGDGCDALCAVELGRRCSSSAQFGNGAGGLDICSVNCGDGLRVSRLEGCDDGNTLSGDGCSSACAIEPGFACTGGTLTSSTCAEICGDGLRVGSETCDDGKSLRRRLQYRLQDGGGLHLLGRRVKQHGHVPGLRRFECRVRRRRRWRVHH